jgi:nitronate monooxygenase
MSANRLTELLGIRLPIVQAPMAGGPSTPALAAAVSNAGGLGSLGGAPPDRLRAAIRETRSLTDRPFAVNLFAPLPPADAPLETVAAVHRALAPFRAELGLPEPQHATTAAAPPFEAQLEVVVEERVPVFSFTFGIPPLDGLACVTMGTATSVAEAVALERAGADVVVAQGAEAGGHRGGDGMVATTALVPQVTDAVSVPVVAAGGIMDGRGIAAALALGAEGVQLGTAFLATPESGAPPAHKRALRDGRETVVTSAYSGRAARAIRTPLIDALEAAGAQAPYPLQAALVADLRRAGAELDRAELQFLLAGQGAPLARELPAAELVALLERELAAALAGAGSRAGSG